MVRDAISFRPMGLVTETSAMSAEDCCGASAGFSVPADALPDVVVPDALCALPDVVVPDVVWALPAVAVPDAACALPDVAAPDAACAFPDVTAPDALCAAPDALRALLAVDALDAGSDASFSAEDGCPLETVREVVPEELSHRSCGFARDGEDGRSAV